MKHPSKSLRAFVLAAAVAAGVVVAGGCGTQYGGPPSSIPRDVETDDATTAAPGTGSTPQPAPQRPGSPSGAGGTGGGGTGTGGGANR